MGAGASSEQSSRDHSQRALSDSAAVPRRQLVLVNGLDAKSRAESFRGSRPTAASQANTRSTKYPTALFVNGQRRLLLAGGELPGGGREETINWSSALQKINQRRRRAQEQGGEDDLRALTRNADPTTLAVLQRLQDVEAMTNHTAAQASANNNTTTTNAGAASNVLANEKLRALQACYPLLERTPPDRFAALASMVYYKEGEIYHSLGSLDLAKTHYTRVIRLAEQRVARQEKDLYMVLKRYVLAMVGLARIWYLEERDTKGFTFADPRRQRLAHRIAKDGSGNSGSHRPGSADSASSLDSLESSLSSEDGGSVYSVNQAILRAMAPRPPRRRTGPHFTRVKLRAPHTVKAELSREDAFVLNSKMTRELVASPCELLLLRCCEVVEIGHNCQSELLLPPLLELAQIYTDLDLLSRALLLVRRCVGILCAVYDYDHPWVIQLLQRAARLNAALDAQRRNAMASKIQATWKMYRAMRALEDALGHPVRRHTTLGARDGRTRGEETDFLNAYLDQIPRHTGTPPPLTAESTPRPRSKHGDPLAVTRAGVASGPRVGRLPNGTSPEEGENALAVYDPVTQEGEVTTYTTAVPNARVIGTTQDTETDTFVQPTAQGAMLTICTTTVARTVTEHMRHDDDDDEEEEEEETTSEEEEEKSDANETTEEYEGSNAAGAAAEPQSSDEEDEEDVEVLSIDRDNLTPPPQEHTEENKKKKNAQREDGEAAEQDASSAAEEQQQRQGLLHDAGTPDDYTQEANVPEDEAALLPERNDIDHQQQQPQQQQLKVAEVAAEQPNNNNNNNNSNAVMGSPFVGIGGGEATEEEEEEEDDRAAPNEAALQDKEEQAQAVVSAVQRARLALQIYHSSRASEGSSVHLTSTNSSLRRRPSSEDRTEMNDVEGGGSLRSRPGPDSTSNTAVSTNVTGTASQTQPPSSHTALPYKNNNNNTNNNITGNTASAVHAKKEAAPRLMRRTSMNTSASAAGADKNARRRKDEARVVISSPPQVLPPLTKPSNANVMTMSSSSLAASQSTTEEGTVRTRAYVEPDKTRSLNSASDEAVAEEQKERTLHNTNNNNKSSSNNHTAMRRQVGQAHDGVFPALPQQVSIARRTSTRSTTATTTTTTTATTNTAGSSTDIKTVNAARRRSGQPGKPRTQLSSTQDSLSSAGERNTTHEVRQNADTAMDVTERKVTRTLVTTEHTKEKRRSSNSSSSILITRQRTPLQSLPDVNNNNSHYNSHVNNTNMARPLRSALTNGHGKKATTPLLTTSPTPVNGVAGTRALRKNSTSLHSQTESNVSAVSSNRVGRQNGKGSELQGVRVGQATVMEDTLSDL